VASAVTEIEPRLQLLAAALCEMHPSRELEFSLAACVCAIKIKLVRGDERTNFGRPTFLSLLQRLLCI
jgi:hypothetical protein